MKKIFFKPPPLFWHRLKICLQKNGDADSQKVEAKIKNSNSMYQLNFQNGNVQTYNSISDMQRAASLLGGEAKPISGKLFAFVPKK